MTNFNYQRTIYFKDTDAAGVVYFANILSLCHEAYESSLINANIPLKTFFHNPDFAIPLTHSTADFFRPIFCGDRITISLSPQQLSESKFMINYEILSSENIVLAKAITHHVCINPLTRKKINIPSEINHWLSGFLPSS